MVKNIIIGVLVLLSAALFFYCVVQQLEANRQAQEASESKLKLNDAIKQAENARLEAEKQRISRSFSASHHQ